MEVQQLFTISRLGAPGEVGQSFLPLNYCGCGEDLFQKMPFASSLLSEHHTLTFQLQHHGVHNLIPNITATLTPTLAHDVCDVWCRYIFCVICTSYIIVQHGAHNLIPNVDTNFGPFNLGIRQCTARVCCYSIGKKNGKINLPSFGQINQIERQPGLTKTTTLITLPSECTPARWLKALLQSQSPNCVVSVQLEPKVAIYEVLRFQITSLEQILGMISESCHDFGGHLKPMS